MAITRRRPPWGGPTGANHLRGAQPPVAEHSGALLMVPRLKPVQQLSDHQRQETDALYLPLPVFLFFCFFLTYYSIRTRHLIGRESFPSGQKWPFQCCTGCQLEEGYVSGGALRVQGALITLRRATRALSWTLDYKRLPELGSVLWSRSDKTGSASATL